MVAIASESCTISKEHSGAFDYPQSDTVTDSVTCNSPKLKRNVSEAVFHEDSEDLAERRKMVACVELSTDVLKRSHC